MSGKALRAALSPADRREVTSAARRVHKGLWGALDALDDLLEDAPADSLTMAERAALKDVRAYVLLAFATLRDRTPDLTGLVPTEALAQRTTDALATFASLRGD